MPETPPRLPFKIDETMDPTLVTGRAGVPLVIESSDPDNSACRPPRATITCAAGTGVLP
jgi:hypothetical protein